MDIDESLDSQASGLIDSQLENETPNLVFPESLLGATKALKVAELIKLLQILHSQLKELDQNVEKESLQVVTKELVHKQIMKNTNKTVKAIAACCLADIIRLHAPACPYSVDVLRTVFMFFVDQLSNFGTESPNFQYHFYLLENLQSVKTFLLLNEIENADELVLPMIEDFFRAAEKDALARNVELCMTDVLIQLIDDVGVLGPELTELILEQFEKHEKGSDNPAYLMALDICYACPNALQRRVCQYFSDILLSVSNTSEDSTEGFEDVKKAHNLIRKINAASPDLLLNVLPLLQEEMKFDHLSIRQLATETMGEMFADQASNVADKYPAIWKTWLGRRNDKSSALRVRWLEMCVDIYKTHPESIAELTECFKDKLADPDDKVRATICKILGEIVTERDVKSFEKPFLELIAERAKDKKSSVRTEAMNTIGLIYNNSYDRIQVNDKGAISKVGWIPDYLFSFVYLGDESVTMGLENTLLNHILPENENDAERTERLVTVYDSLQPKQRLAFTALIRRQKLFNENMHDYIKRCENALNNTNLSEHEVATSDEFMKYMTTRFADKARTLNALRSFLNSESERDVKTLKSAIDLDCNYKQVIAAKKKLLSNLNEDQTAIVDIFVALLNRACPLLLNKSNVSHLLKLTKSARGRRHTVSSQRAVAAQNILKEMSITYPSMYTSNMNDIINDIMSDNDSTADDSLKILSEISKSNKNEMTFADNVIERLTDYITNGSAQQAKYASIALANMKNAGLILADLASRLSDELLMGASNLLVNLTTLSQFALYSCELIHPTIDSIIRFIDKNLLATKTRQFFEGNPEWCTYDELPELSQQKLVGVSLLVNYLTACRDTIEPEEYIVSNIFTILWSLLDTTCESAIADKINAAETSHLRLGGTQSIVKLTQYAKYLNELTVPNFEKLSYTLQDTCYYVRQEFAETLMKGLQTKEIHSRYYSLLFICAHEPEASLLKQVKSFIQKRLTTMVVRSGESSVLDSSLVRLIHLLAHHPDFTEAVEDLVVFAQYLKFYLSCVATANNVSFLYHIVQKIKLSKDMITEELSKNSYVLSDLAALLIRTKSKEASWPLNAYEGHVSLQSKLYRTLPAGAVQAETIKKNYLPKEFIELYEEEQKHKPGEKRSRFSSSVSNKKVKV
ncbi:MAG: armadillo-type protein [Benjaminiella poitrasii]|nr:MAG: armadillo-type protein [Benjaminiella poitrasii]